VTHDDGATSAESSTYPGGDGGAEDGTHSPGLTFRTSR